MYMKNLEVKDLKNLAILASKFIQSAFESGYVSFEDLGIEPVRREKKLPECEPILRRYLELKGVGKNGGDLLSGGYGKGWREARNLLDRFLKLPDPLSVALECLEEKGKEFEEADCSWTLSTVVRWADEWLAKKKKVVK